MATTAITLSKTVWTKITDAGESGTCWKKAGGQIVLDHTDGETAATLPLTNTNVTIEKSKIVPLDDDSGFVLSISADNVDDVFYALAVNESEVNKISVDVA